VTRSSEKGEEEVPEITTAERTARRYYPEARTMTQFVSTSPVSELWNSIGAFTNIMTSSYSFHSKEYKVTLKVT